MKIKDQQNSAPGTPAVVADAAPGTPAAADESAGQ